jgi:hypothetical protein
MKAQAKPASDGLGGLMPAAPPVVSVAGQLAGAARYEPAASDCNCM